MEANRYAIHMEDGRIVPLTSELLENYIYQEIPSEIALAVDRGEIDAQDVIADVEAQLPKESMRVKMQKMLHQNVRTTDFGLKEAARAAVNLGPSKAVKLSLSDLKARKNGKGGVKSAKGGSKPDKAQKPSKEETTEETPPNEEVNI